MIYDSSISADSGQAGRTDRRGGMVKSSCSSQCASYWQCLLSYTSVCILHAVNIVTSQSQCTISVV